MATTTKKNTVGLVWYIVTIVAAVAGLIAYYINSQTSYFSSMGLDTTTIACAVIAIVLEVVYLIVGLKGTPMWADLLPLASAVLLIVSAMLLLNTRVTSFAAIISFNNNASNMSDMYGAIVAIVILAVAAICSCVASFYDLVKTSDK